MKFYFKMKTLKKSLNLFLLLAFLSVNAQTTKDQLIGKWKGEDGKEIGYVTFDAQDYATFEINGRIIGGKEFNFEGKIGMMKYEIISQEKELIKLDFVVTVFEKTKKVKRLMGIFKVIDYHTIEVALGFNDIRPTEFNTDNSITLKREKN